VVLLGMSAYLAGVTGAPLTSAVIAMELTNNQEMVIPIMAACLLARAAASIFCPTPVYKDFAERMMQDFERQHAQHTEAQQQRGDAETVESVDAADAYGEPARSTEPPAKESDR
jgi:H+/Cl- antiporter ClcA